jgi:hypothetical protein
MYVGLIYMCRDTHKNTEGEGERQTDSQNEGILRYCYMYAIWMYEWMIE